MKRLIMEEHADEGLLNLTPLIDVVFVILVMFILIAPMIEIDHIHLAEGAHTEKTHDSARKGLTIHVRADGSILVNHHLIKMTELEQTFKRLHDESPHAFPQLFQDKEAKFGTYQSVKNALERAGFESLDVILSYD
jgi:Biopolymer transport protein